MPGKNIGFLLFSGVLILFMSGCAGQGVNTAMSSPKSAQAQKLTLAEQDEKAYGIFEQILDLSKAPDREENLPEIKRLYREIIEQYPETYLAQECYLRLIIIAKDEKSPSGDREAEQLHQEFLQTYPDSKLRSIVAEKLKSGS